MFLTTSFDLTLVIRFSENSHLRAGQETRRTARDRHPHSCPHEAQQARGLLHPVQDTGNLNAPILHRKTKSAEKATERLFKFN